MLWLISTFPAICNTQSTRTCLVHNGYFFIVFIEFPWLIRVSPRSWTSPVCPILQFFVQYSSFRIIITSFQADLNMNFIIFHWYNMVNSHGIWSPYNMIFKIKIQVTSKIFQKQMFPFRDLYFWHHFWIPRWILRKKKV